jgi:WYL domain
MPHSERSKPEKYDAVKGFGLGTAILSVTQLKQVYSLIAKVVGSLNDPTQDVLQNELKERLQKADIDVDQHIPIRGFANRSILDAKHADAQSLAHRDQLDKVAATISECKAIRVKVRQDGKWVEQLVWPLQILFHNIAWYLAYQQANDVRGVITVTRLDRLMLTGLLPHRRSVKDMLGAQRRLHLLCKRCGGILLSRDGKLQEDVLGLPFRDSGVTNEPKETLNQKQLKALISNGSMTLVRFRCTAEVFAFMREGFNRYPPEQMRLSGPRPGDTWKLPDIGVEQLQPCLDENEPRPYPVEFILPSWTVEHDIDFRRWLFGFGSRIVIEAPEPLRKKHQDFGAGIAELYPASATEVHEPADHGISSTSEDKTPPC